MLISDWSSDVCSSDLVRSLKGTAVLGKVKSASADAVVVTTPSGDDVSLPRSAFLMSPAGLAAAYTADQFAAAKVMQRPDMNLLAAASSPSAPTVPPPDQEWRRSEEHPSELQSLMRISYAVFCLHTKNKQYSIHHTK